MGASFFSGKLYRMKRNLLLIDGHHFLFKAYGAPFKSFSNKGTPLHVTTVFLSLTRRAVAVLDQQFEGCTDIAVVFDRPGKTANNILSKAYKANRKKDYSQDEDSPFLHLPTIAAALKHLKIKTYIKKGYEADDLIASLAAQYLKEHKGARAFIASSDSDFYQLLAPRVTQIIFGKRGATTIFGPQALREKYNITPRQYVYFKSLTGDKSDNIAGVPKVGPVRASQIINKKIPFDARDHAEMLALNKKLIALNCGMDVCKNWKHVAVSPRVRAMSSNEIFEKAGF